MKELGSVRIVSPRFRRILEMFGVSVEFFPITLTGPQGQSVAEGYSFAHMTAELPCLDQEKAVYTVDRDYMDRIAHLAIDEWTTEGSDLFRLAKSYDMPVFVSERLASETSQPR